MGVIHHARNGRGVKYLAEQRTPTTQQKVTSMVRPPHPSSIAVNNNLIKNVISCNCPFNKKWKHAP